MKSGCWRCHGNRADDACELLIGHNFLSVPVSNRTLQQQLVTQEPRLAGLKLSKEKTLVVDSVKARGRTSSLEPRWRHAATEPGAPVCRPDFQQRGGVGENALTGFIFRVLKILRITQVARGKLMVSHRYFAYVRRPDRGPGLRFENPGAWSHFATGTC